MGAPPMGGPVEAPPASLMQALLGPLAGIQAEEQAKLQAAQSEQVASLVAAMSKPNPAGLAAVSEPAPMMLPDAPMEEEDELGGGLPPAGMEGY